MTVRQLLRSTDSAELTMWSVFLEVDQERTKARLEREKRDRDLEDWVGGA